LDENIQYIDSESDSDSDSDSDCVSASVTFETVLLFDEPF